VCLPALDLLFGAFGAARLAKTSMLPLEESPSNHTGGKRGLDACWRFFRFSKSQRDMFVTDVESGHHLSLCG
jgi:hypothetical protein